MHERAYRGHELYEYYYWDKLNHPDITNTNKKKKTM